MKTNHKYIVRKPCLFLLLRIELYAFSITGVATYIIDTKEYITIQSADFNGSADTRALLTNGFYRYDIEKTGNVKIQFNAWINAHHGLKLFVQMHVVAYQLTIPCHFDVITPRLNNICSHTRLFFPSLPKSSMCVHSINSINPVIDAYDYQFLSNCLTYLKRGK